MALEPALLDSSVQKPRVTREATVNDLHALVALFVTENQHNATLAPETVRVTSDVLTAPELQAIIDDAGQQLLVAEREDLVVGALLGQITRTREHRWVQSRCTGYVDELIVSPHARRQGVADDLLAAFESWAAAQGATALELHVWSNNDGAIRFYAQSGFAEKQHLLTKPLRRETP